MDMTQDVQCAVIFGKEIAVGTIAAAHADLLSVLENSSSVLLDISAVNIADLTTVQLIEAARQSAVRAGKTLKLSGPATGELRSVLERGGFISAEASESRNFWLHEGPQ